MLFKDTNDDKIDLTLFEDAVHQIAKLTSDTVEVKGLTQADKKSILFTSLPICISYNRRSKVVENLNYHVVPHFVVVTSQVERKRVKFTQTVRISYTCTL